MYKTSFIRIATFFILFFLSLVYFRSEVSAQVTCNPGHLCIDRPSASCTGYEPSGGCEDFMGAVRNCCYPTPPSCSSGYTCMLNSGCTGTVMECFGGGMIGDCCEPISVGGSSPGGGSPGGSSTIDWGSISGGSGYLSPERWFVMVYNVLYPLAIGVGVLGIILAGYTYMTSTGRPDKVKEGTEKLTSAITGIIFIVLSLVILRVIMSLLLGT